LIRTKICGFLLALFRQRSWFAVSHIDAPDETTDAHELTDYQQAEEAIPEEYMNETLHITFSIFVAHH
jgi:hypothetical protein